MGRRTHLRLFGLVIFSIAIDLALIIYSPLKWEQGREGALSMQIHMSATHNNTKADL